MRAVAGVLDDGTPFYAPIGETISDGQRVTCHLCGRALGDATVAGYIRRRRADGWTWKAIAAESGQPQTWLRRQA